ncbi:MAG: hypothetical protein NTW21_18480 [Verrucomicrobia bacterium]|nr:hypothetical protein [Verrucomicrobiota bacterium]
MKNHPHLSCLAGLALSVLWLAPNHALAQASPDVFGYKLTSGYALADFEEISSGANLGITLAALSSDDSYSEAVSIGFPFYFYGNQYTTCYIGTNGYITFGSGSSAYPNHAGASFAVPFPKTISPRNVIAGFFADLKPGDALSGKIFFDTLGTAPNRRFIVQWQNVSYYSTPAKHVTFQIKLFEGTNIAEMHYKALDPTAETLRNFGIGIQNATADSGITHGYGIESNLGAIPLYQTPFNQFGLRFERPVMVTVESALSQGTVLTPGATTKTIGDGKVAFYGTHTKDGAGHARYPGSTVTFDAPEFIYFNKDGVELDAIGGLDEPDATKACYRARNVGYAIDGEAVQGVARFFERTITRDIKVIWKWELEYAAFIESKDLGGVDLAPGIGNAVPEVGRIWLARDSQFSSAMDRTVGQDPFGLDLSGFRYAAKTYQLNVGGPAGTRVERPAVTLGGTGNRVVTENTTINDWLRVRWTWAGQMRYRFDAAIIDAAQGNPPLLQETFVRTFFLDNPSTTTVDESLTADHTYFSIAPSNEVWLDVGRKVQVGSFYRTFDRCYTLRNFPAAPSGDLAMLGTDVSSLTDITLGDEVGVSRVARASAVGTVGKPTEVHFLYEPTVFRAEVALGQAFDAMNPDLQLIPALCDGAVLRAADLGPAESFTRVGTYVPDGTATGFPVRWDQLGKRLLPVHPGSYQLVWPNADDPTKTYRIEIVSGFPGESVPLSSAREDATGMREGSAPAYVTTTTLAGTASEFPASPAAHYRHRYASTPDRSPPTKLDLSATDPWKFQALTFAERTTVAAVDTATAGVPFSTRGSGRSVLLFSYRPNPDEVANGDLTEENLAVRVVESTPVAPLLPDSAENPLGRRGLELGGGAAAGNGAVGVISRGSGAPAMLDSGANFVLDFWLNTKHLQPGDSPVTVLSTGPGKLEVMLDPATSTITARCANRLSVRHPLANAGAGWSHYVIHVFGETFFGIPVTLLYFDADGRSAGDGLVTTLIPGGATAAFSVGSSLLETSLKFGVGANPERLLRLDQVRLFANVPGTYLTPAEVRSLREHRATTLRMSGGVPMLPVLHFNFEAAPTNPGTGAFSFANTGTVANVGVGPKSANDRTGLWTGLWARLDVQEVATRLDSALDDAGFNGSGYVLNAISNYNAALYNRAAEVGTWGPLFPVNEKRLYTEPARRLEVAYYENPYRHDGISHPNVAWPYREAAYDEVIYPTYGPHKDKAIYIASRSGSEGVDRSGKLQPVFDLAAYANFSIYNQPGRNLPGFNPNEEHAIAAASGRAALKLKNLGDDIPNNPPLAAFALQSNINVTSGTGYTSAPWVLVQVDNLTTGEPEMAAYQVFKTRDGTKTFPRPSDPEVNATPGLAYESATAPEDRFLTMDPAKTYNFNYQFDYPVFAGDLLIPPYPLNLVIGNVTMLDERGGNIQVAGVNQRTLWRDVSHHAWVASGGGRFFHQFFYPFRSDFFLPSPVTPGTPLAWLPQDNVHFTGSGASLQPVRVIYNSSWRTTYPKLKRGETLTYQGGEAFNENPGSEGLPALVAMAAAEVVFDSATPSMTFTTAAAANTYRLSDFSARIIRPLDRRERPFTQARMTAAGFTPDKTDKLFIVAERWYFKELPGSLQKRFYFDSLAQKLVFRGRLNEKESGDADLTAGPDPLNILEPNVLTSDEYKRVSGLSSDGDWRAAITALYLQSQNPHDVSTVSASVTNPVFLSGLKPKPAALNLDTDFYRFYALTGNALPIQVPEVLPLDSFGVGAALVPSPKLLERGVSGSLFVTIAENNRSELAGAPVSLHIIEIVPDRYRGAIKVIEAADAFSEKITLQHNGEFGANTDDLYYEWWIRDAAPLDLVATEVLDNGTLTETDAQGHSLWQQYIPADRAALTDQRAKHLGLHSIVFEGRPDVVLADKLVLMRYRHKNESSWTLVPFEITNPAAEWKPGNVPPASPAPFQWAGAANSPQLQADGSKRYIPQLVMGWVKRVLDRINPYEARYTDFFSNESPATYSSQIQIAGAPFAGKVALNPDKNVIEHTGLIELYETVLARARELSIDNSSNPVSTDGINQALLLAATRLAVLYELLAREAYSDAQDSTIAVTDDGGLASVAPYTFAFQNMEADLLHEELALLRGTDFRKSYPVYNRLFWNYAKGLGEAAYNVNYNIYDENTDGFINEDDARALYPQGHGDAWGHYLSALGMHYTLLQHPTFNWKTRSELYSLMQNVLEVDFLDEKTFAKLAAGKARAGRDIVRDTYRLNYTQDPDGQWQGYTDGADPARAWGVSEWAHRTGQGAYFDWAVANSLLPDQAVPVAPGSTPENLDHLERLGASDEIGEIAGGLYEIQLAMDEANGGVNPLGFDSDAITFDLDPAAYDSGNTHFEQIYNRALAASSNALATLDFATKAGNKLRRIADDTDALTLEALRQDLDYRNRLIEIFGRPYEGTIGFGKPFPEGYEGPDTFLYAYLDKTKISQLVPQTKPEADSTTVHFNNIFRRAKGLMDNPTMVDLYNDVWGGSGATERKAAFESLVGANLYELETPPGVPFTAPYNTASKYGFQAPATWGQRTSYGKVQRALEDMLLTEVGLDQSVSDYISFLKDFENKTKRLQSELKLFQERQSLGDQIDIIRQTVNGTFVAIETAIGIFETISTVTGDIAAAVAEALPTSIGFSNDVTSVGRGIALAAAVAAEEPIQIVKNVKDIAKLVDEMVRDEMISGLEGDIELVQQISALEGLVEELSNLAGGDQSKRDAVGMAVQSLELNRQDYFTAQAEGFRLLREREAFNKILAAKVQKNRYQDMIFRLSRNEAMGKYQSAFDHAARYAWLAARAYDYETSLDPGHPAAPGVLLDKLVKERQLGLWSGDGQPQAGQGGLAEILNHLNGNFQVLKGQLGLNNPQSETAKISLRSELFRIGPGVAGGGAAASDERWTDALKARIEPDLNQMPEFVRYCRPFASAGTGSQPGVVIRFRTSIEPGLNCFGLPLAAGDHNYSSANFATKVRGFGVWLDNYNAAGLSTSPRAYLVPVGDDYLRVSTAAQPLTRAWGVREQRIPTPFTINQGNLTAPGFIPTLNGLEGGFGELRRHGDFRMYHDHGSAVDDAELVMDSRLIGRSVWNSEWLLIIPGADLHVDPATGLTKLAETVTDIKLYFQTYSHQGQ